MTALAAMIGGVRSLGLDTCMTLGMLSAEQAQALGQAGLDYYNHNLDTSAQDYARVISTRSHADRLDTLHAVRAAGIKVCCGGIVGMGETRADRVGLLTELANLQPYPESVPINQLVPVPGTRLANAGPVDPFEFVRTVAAARITMPRASVRLSAGRAEMDDATQALCFLAGANAIFYGDQLLTTANPAWVQDQQLLQRLGLRVQASPDSV